MQLITERAASALALVLMPMRQECGQVGCSARIHHGRSEALFVVGGSLWEARRLTRYWDVRLSLDPEAGSGKRSARH